MEEKLIIAVGNHPVLYDQSLFMYRDSYRRDQAWKEVAEAVGESASFSNISCCKGNLCNDVTQNITQYTAVTQNFVQNITQIFSVTKNFIQNITQIINGSQNVTQIINGTQNITQNVTQIVNVTQNITQNVPEKFVVIQTHLQRFILMMQRQTCTDEKVVPVLFPLMSVTEAMTEVENFAIEMNGRASVETAGIKEMSREEDERQSTEAGEKRSKRRVRRNSIHKDTPNFSQDSDRLQAEIHSHVSQRDIHRLVCNVSDRDDSAEVLTDEEQVAEDLNDYMSDSIHPDYIISAPGLL
ncbi:transcription factor Adf-1-like protein [Labeo rohita]|uniref:Transcription factor Adf-1-like protein n=1 Tax=Labeo rohita TaxID=84645 RepID=A0A498LVJ5_LABRO|nr:transcription factor Adf-1-like protein [Labeo rohita]